MKKILAHIRNKNFKHLLDTIIKRISSSNNAYGLKRDLDAPHTEPEAKIPLKIRQLHDGDLEAFSANLTNYGLFQSGIKTGYVATNENDIPCYYQWLIGASDNKGIQEFWKGAFPVLSENEALLENAFTIPEFRGLRIMPAAMSRIAMEGKKINARYVITFVDMDNIPSLKGCLRAGFEPYILRTEKWFLFRKTTTFKSIPETMFHDFNQQFAF